MISEHDRQVLQGLPSWNPVGNIAAQRRAWELLAVTYNQDLPTIGALEENVALRPDLHADVAVPHGAGIAIGGDSAGANLALSALTSSPEQRLLVRAALLFYGAFDLNATAERTRSLPGLQQQLLTYVSGVERLLGDPRVSPLNAVAPGILPPCFILGAETDSWCLADSLALAQSLSAVTSSYELHVMEGMPHGFMQMSTLDGFRAAMRLICEFLARNV